MKIMEIEGANENSLSDLTSISEGCVSDILSHTSPRDACRVSGVSRGFKSLADSDAVWERFLPADYKDIISRSDSPLVSSSKKELYFRICASPILLDGGKMSFTLDKRNGKKRFLLGARELSIAWKDTMVYWRWKSLPESRFSQVAQLLAVCWLEIKGKFPTRMLSPKTTYAAYLVFNVGAACHGLDFLVKTSVRLVGQDAAKEERRAAYLRPPHSACQPRRQAYGNVLGERSGKLPQMRIDGWMEVELGEFYVESGDDDGQVEMRLGETEKLHWKSGLIVEGIDVRPKD